MDEQEAGAAPSGQEEPAGGFSVTITDNGDGTFSVAPSDSDEDQGGASGPTECNSLDEALSTAQALFEQESGEDSQEPQEGGDEPMAPSDAQSYWNQMAGKRDKARQA